MTTSTFVERRRLRSRRVLLALSTILCSGLAAPAFADSPYKNLDGNGVDLTDGSFNLSLLEGSIGSGQGELPLIAYNAATTNWNAAYIEQTVSGSTYTLTIINGTDYDNFTGTVSGTTTLASSRATGATLTGDGMSWSYRYHDGSTLTFGNPVGSPGGGVSNICDANNQTNCRLYAMRADGKAGMTVTYNYAEADRCSRTVNPDDTIDCNYYFRPSSVSNDAGYAINFGYVSNAGGSGPGAPAPGWFQIASATFTNANVSASSWPTVTYSRPSSLVTNITTPGSKVWRLTNDGNGRIVGVKRPSASSDTTTVSYNSGGVSSVTNNGITTSYNRTVSGTTATMTVTDAQSHVTTIVSDMTKYRPTSVTDPLSHVTTFAYDSVGRPTEVIYPEGNKVQYTYDGRGNATATTLKAKSGSGLSDIVTTASYPSSCTDVSCNSPIWTKDALGNQTDYTYDTSTGNLLTVTAPAATSGAVRPQTRYSYTTVSGVSVLTGTSQCQSTASCTGTSDEVVASTSYNSNLLPTNASSGSGDGVLTAPIAATYDAIGNLLTVDGPLSGTVDTTTYRYDPDRARVGVISPDPDGGNPLKRRAVKTTYNSDGQATVTELGTVNGTSDSDWAAFASAQQSTATYDANAYKTKDVVTASGTTYSVLHYSYDAVGRLECTAQRLNSATWGSLPSSACTLGTTGSFGPDRIGKVTFDAAGRTTKVQSAYGTSDQADEATGTYNANNTLATLTDAQVNTTTYEYDGFDRLSKTRYSVTTAGSGSSSTTDYEQLIYDADSRVTSRRIRGYASDSTQHIDYDYDALGRVATKHLPPGIEPDVAYTYDLQGRLLSAARPGQTPSFSYDALGRVLTQSGPLGTITATYDAAGRRTRLTWPDAFYVTYDYLVTGEMTAISDNQATPLVLASYGYDDLGRRTSLTRGNGTSTTYTPDNVSRLSSLAHAFGSTGSNATSTFSYNPASQIAATTHSNDAYAWTDAANRNDASAVNGLNQVTTVGAVSVGYDARGNLNGTGANSYSYSGENLLLSGPGAKLRYDPLMRLYSEFGTGYTTTRFQYDGQALIAEYDDSGTRQKRYVHGAGTDEPVVEYDASGNRTWLTADERGSVVARSNDSGAVTAINSYDEYGVPASANAGRIGYTGQAWLPSLGLWYYKARMYSSRLGRFMQTDPIGYGDGVNWYGYVGGDPINRKDPSGLAKYVELNGVVYIFSCVVDPDTHTQSCGLRKVGLSSSNQISNNPNGQEFSGGSRGDGDEIPPQSDEEKKFCAALANDDTGKRVSPFVRNFPNVWNDTSSLKFHMDYANQQAASNEAFAAAVGFGGMGLNAAGISTGVIGRFATARATGAIGLVLSVDGYLTNLVAADQRTEAKSIEARIRRLNAAKSGICPGVPR